MGVEKCLARNLEIGKLVNAKPERSLCSLSQKIVIVFKKNPTNYRDIENTNKGNYTTRMKSNEEDAYCLRKKTIL